MRFFFMGPRIMGIRPGIIVSPREIGRLFQSRPAAAPVEGSFLYVIGGPPGMVKIGVTTDPRGRLAELQTGSPYPLDFVAIAATPRDGYDIEARAHGIMYPYRASGEWFRAHPLAAITAIQIAAQELGEPLLRISLDQADSILAVARNAPAGSSVPPPLPGRWRKPLWIVLGVLGVLMLLGLGR